jgi:hypothetical protein
MTMRYFFHVRDGQTIISDPEGTECGSLDEAVVEAKVNARELMAERLRAGRAINGQIFELTDDTGQIVAHVKFKDALE